MQMPRITTVSGWAASSTATNRSATYFVETNVGQEPWIYTSSTRKSMKRWISWCRLCTNLHQKKTLKRQMHGGRVHSKRHNIDRVMRFCRGHGTGDNLSSRRARHRNKRNSTLHVF